MPAGGLPLGRSGVADLSLVSHLEWGGGWSDTDPELLRVHAAEVLTFAAGPLWRPCPRGHKVSLITPAPGEEGPPGETQTHILHTAAPPCLAGRGRALCLVTSRVTSTGALGASRPCPCVPDVDECAAETPPCGDQQYCENVNGSFACEGAWARAPAGGRLCGSAC